MSEEIKWSKFWYPIPRVSRTIPFGYKESEEDCNVLLPIPLELEYLEKAKKLKSRFSYVELANWITEGTGRYISHEGLRKRLNNERRRKQKAVALRQWARKVQRALEKAEKYDQYRLGSGEDSEWVSESKEGETKEDRE